SSVCGGICSIIATKIRNNIRHWWTFRHIAIMPFM
uniref:Uncharacterized protein n=1 Tax=Ciona savignyi TaxID=51511 RepID=H2Y5M6_CIOSA